MGSTGDGTCGNGIREGISDGKSEGISEPISGSGVKGASVSKDVGAGEISPIGADDEFWEGSRVGIFVILDVVGEAVGVATGATMTGASVLTAIGLCVGALVEVGAIGTGAFCVGIDEGTSLGILMSFCSNLQMPLNSSSRMASASVISFAIAVLTLLVRRFL